MEDEKIISLFVKRVESAITETSKKYGGLCLKIANNILYDKCDAEECVNDTYLKVWNTIPPTIPNIFSAYVAKITRNLSINLYKKNNAQKRGNGEIELVLDELSECIPDHSSVDEIFDRKEITKAISVFLDSIDDEKKQIFIQRYWYGEPMSVVCKNFNMTESKIKSMLFRVRKELKKHLEAEGIVI